MRLKNKVILLISPEPWQHVFVSKHHYAIHLGKGSNRVFFLNPPSYSEGIVRTEFENVYSVNYKGFPPGLRFYPSFLQRYFLKKRIAELQERCDTIFDVIWSFDNSVFFDFSIFGDSVLKISHIVDLNQDFQLASAARTADICFCTTTRIQDRLSQYSKRVFKIPHGFNDHPISAERIKLPGMSDIKALYSGNLAMPYIDWIVLKNIVNEHPEIDFIFLGPNAKQMHADAANNVAKAELIKSENVYLLGIQPSLELMRYYSAADVLIVCYQEKYHADQANPHKMMEYLGSGKVIVSSFTGEFADRRDLIAMASTNDTFGRVFNAVTDNLEFYNAPDLMAKRKAFALSNTYTEQIRRIETILTSDVGIESQ